VKIFLSHSSKDKWAARRIARDLEDRGATVFLDEKDIKTGESLDIAIRANLVDSNHFMLLLSPASAKSEWVLLELGGALALQKVVIPILLYVGANELPQAISLRLSRDINEIEKYYDEVEAAVSGHSPPRRTRKSARRKASAKKKAVTTGAPFGVGAKVRIVTDQPKKLFRSTGTDVAWIPDMDRFLGRAGKVISVDTDGDVTLDLDADLAWAPEWLAPSDAT